MVYSIGESSKSNSRASSTSGVRKNRQTSTNQERIELRKWWHDPSFGKRDHRDAIHWFKEKFGRSLSTSTMSDYLGAKWAYLDTEELSKYERTLTRLREPEYKELEEALAEWQLRYDRHPDSGSTTGELLRIKATELWGKLPVYSGQPCPSWSNGWLAGFKKRYNLKERRRHGEGASAQIDEESEAIMAEIRRVGREYGPENTYNMDESGFFWKLKPDRSLSSFEAHGTKKQKARITANFCCNAAGTDKLPIWFIGTAKRPNCFRTENLTEIDHLGAVWRHNKSAWMTHHIMKEWLRWFENLMIQKGKKALLLMDNFSAHDLGVEQMEEANELRQTKVSRSLLSLPFDKSHLIINDSLADHVAPSKCNL
jgi:DDE superfamily endonuclease/Fission yeast centromere protein N-terminal domain/Tc5 transposase DNA-binding domain